LEKDSNLQSRVFLALLSLLLGFFVVAQSVEAASFIDVDVLVVARSLE